MQWGLAPLGRLGWAVGFLFVTGGGAAPGALQHPEEHRQALLRGLPSPAAAGDRGGDGVLLSRRVCTTCGSAARAARGVVPALLMVSTIRFRSFKTIDLGMRRGYRGLILLAACSSRCSSRYPHEVLLVMAYGVSRVGVHAIAQCRRRRAGCLPAPSVTPTSRSRARYAAEIGEIRSYARPSSATQVAARGSAASSSRSSPARSAVDGDRSRRSASTLRLAIVRPRPVPVACVEK